MKKQDFIALGLEEDIALQCETASMAELKGFIPKSRLDEVITKKTQLEEALAERDAQLESLKHTSGNLDALRQQIETLQAENAQKEEAHLAEVKQLRMDAAIEKALLAANAKNLTAAKALLDLQDAELLEDGTVKGLSEKLEALTKAPDSSFLFDASSGKTKLSGLTPAEGQDVHHSGSKTPEQMNYTELCAYLQGTSNVSSI